MKPAWFQMVWFVCLCGGWAATGGCGRPPPREFDEGEPSRWITEESQKRNDAMLKDHLIGYDTRGLPIYGVDENGNPVYSRDKN